MIIASAVDRKVTFGPDMSWAVQLLMSVVLVVASPVVSIARDCSAITPNHGGLVIEAEAQFKTPLPLVVRVLSSTERSRQFISTSFQGRCVILDEFDLAPGYQVSINYLPVDGSQIVAVVCSGESADSEMDTNIHIYDVDRVRPVGVLESIGNPEFIGREGRRPATIVTFTNRFRLEVGPLWPNIYVLRKTPNAVVIELAPRDISCDRLGNALRVSKEYALSLKNSSLENSEWVRGEATRIDEQVRALVVSLDGCSLLRD